VKSVLAQGVIGTLVLVLFGCAAPPKRESPRPAESGMKQSALRSDAVSRPAPTRQTTAETLIGAIMGEEVGRSIRRSDELRAADALEKNRTGEASSWVNPETGNWVAVVPTRTYQLETGQFCREYQADVNGAGGKGRAYGRACRQPDGSWKLVNRL
jgi:surface antigen